jgi:arabinoxylan arabinofuranohydrolase
MMQIPFLKREAILLSIVFIGISAFLNAQNPITPEGIYFADPSAHVWNNGKLYLYGSLDESNDYYCSWQHYIVETDDLKNWKIYDNRFSSKGDNDQVKYNDELLYAPDCAFRNDTFYLYYCQPDQVSAEGVATSLKPHGPFKNGIPLALPNDCQQIDPSLFIDFDGQAYYMWGQFSLKMAKMKPNMRELDLTTFKDSIITETEHYFHEGAFMTRREGIYYLVFADISRADMPTCIGYATSSSPFGPYKYRGVIIDNNQCNPGNWNNHGSIAEFNNNWYVFYHRSTHGSNKMRKACIEPISFLPDGSILEVEMTSQGAGGPLDATSRIGAEQACLLQGNLRIQAFKQNDEELTQIRTGDKAVFKYIDFDSGIKRIKLRIAPGLNGGKLILTVDKPWHTQLATIDIKANTGNKEWQTLSFDVTSICGVHALWFQFWGQGEDLMSIDWFQFEK